MQSINIRMPEPYKQEIEKLADKETFGNVTMLIRLALVDKYPSLRDLSATTRKKRGNGKGRGNE